MVRLLEPSVLDRRRRTVVSLDLLDEFVSKVHHLLFANHLFQLQLALLPGVSLLFIRPLTVHLHQGPHGLIINFILFRCTSV